MEHSKDDTMIHNKWFFNLIELFVREERINNSNHYCNIDEDNNGFIPDSATNGQDTQSNSYVEHM